MTISAPNSNPVFHQGDGSTATFSFPFHIFNANHLSVYTITPGVTPAQMVLGVDYTVAGVDNVLGGSITTLTPAIPASGSVLQIAHTPPYEQQTVLPAAGYLDLPTIERMVDKAVNLALRNQEILTRCLAFRFATLNAYRNMEVPQPVALKLLGFNATADGLSLYDAAITQVEVSDTAHIAYGETTVVIPASSGQVQLTGAAVFPVGCIRIGAIVRVTTTFGNGNGLTTFSAGSTNTIDRWGAGLARTATSAPTGANNPGSFRMFELKPIASAEAVVLTADAGTFDATGSATVTGSYLTLTAA